MKNPRFILISAAALLAVAVSFDLGSKHSWLGQAMEKGRASLASGKKSSESSVEKEEAAADKLRVEAREIWARMGRIDNEQLRRLRHKFVHAAEPKKLYHLLQEMGITLSRQRFDAVLSSQKHDRDLLTHLLKAWCQESPLEAVAWGYYINSRTPPNAGLRPDTSLNLTSYLCVAFDAIPHDSAAWIAFLKESPDPILTTLTDLLVKEAQSPGYFWSQIEELQTREIAVAYYQHLLDKGADEQALIHLLKCPIPRLKIHWVSQFGSQQSSETLRRLAKIAAPIDPVISNVYFALGGDSHASFNDAFIYLSASSDIYKNESLKVLYDQWLKVGDIQEGLSLALAPERDEDLKFFLEKAVQSPNLNEALFVRSLQDIEPSRRDSALVRFYLTQTRGDHWETLDQILQSPQIQDEVESARLVLLSWSTKNPSEAAQWFQSLPNQQEHYELASEIAGPWLEREPEGAVKFILDQNLSLSGYFRNFAHSITASKLSEETQVRLIKKLQSEPEYENLVVEVMLIYSSSDFARGIDFAKKYSLGPWQTTYVDVVNRRLPRDALYVTEIIREFGPDDLSMVPPEKLKVYRENVQLLALKYPESNLVPKKP